MVSSEPVMSFSTLEMLSNNITVKSFITNCLKNIFPVVSYFYQSTIQLCFKCKYVLNIKMSTSMMHAPRKATVTATRLTVSWNWRNLTMLS